MKTPRPANGTKPTCPCSCAPCTPTPHGLTSWLVFMNVRTADMSGARRFVRPRRSPTPPPDQVLRQRNVPSRTFFPCLAITPMGALQVRVIQMKYSRFVHPYGDGAD